jgi:enoyl-CoA hydratase/carnithine racemase
MEAVDRGLDLSLDDGLLLEANHFGLLAATEDMREGTTAFLEKREARFTGK